LLITLNAWHINELKSFALVVQRINRIAFGEVRLPRPNDQAIDTVFIRP
jgi:hypothetical protein